MCHDNQPDQQLTVSQNKCLTVIRNNPLQALQTVNILSTISGHYTYTRGLVQSDCQVTGVATTLVRTVSAEVIKVWSHGM